MNSDITTTDGKDGKTYYFRGGKRISQKAALAAMGSASKPGPFGSGRKRLTRAVPAPEEPEEAPPKPRTKVPKKAAPKPGSQAPKKKAAPRRLAAQLPAAPKPVDPASLVQPVKKAAEAVSQSIQGLGSRKKAEMVFDVELGVSLTDLVSHPDAGKYVLAALRRLPPAKLSSLGRLLADDEVHPVVVFRALGFSDLAYESLKKLVPRVKCRAALARSVADERGGTVRATCSRFAGKGRVLCQLHLVKKQQDRFRKIQGSAELSILKPNPLTVFAEMHEELQGAYERHSRRSGFLGLPLEVLELVLLRAETPQVVVVSKALAFVVYSMMVDAMNGAQSADVRSNLLPVPPWKVWNHLNLTRDFSRRLFCADRLPFLYLVFLGGPARDQGDDLLKTLRRRILGAAVAGRPRALAKAVEEFEAFAAANPDPQPTLDSIGSWHARSSTGLYALIEGRAGKGSRETFCDPIARLLVEKVAPSDSDWHQSKFVEWLFLARFFALFEAARAVTRSGSRLDPKTGRETIYQVPLVTPKSLVVLWLYQEKVFRPMGLPERLARPPGCPEVDEITFSVRGAAYGFPQLFGEHRREDGRVTHIAVDIPPGDVDAVQKIVGAAADPQVNLPFGPALGGYVPVGPLRVQGFPGPVNVDSDAPVGLPYDRRNMDADGDAPVGLPYDRRNMDADGEDADEDPDGASGV